MSLPELGDNLIAMFERQALHHGAAPLLYAKRDGAWQARSWQQTAEEVAALAAVLASLGVAVGDKVAIIAENRPEWCIADLAILRCGAITVPSYTTYTADDYAWQLDHCEAQTVITSGGTIGRRVLEAVGRTPRVRTVIALDPLPTGSAAAWAQLDYAEALSRGRAAPAARDGLERDPDEIACFIYTSGTGGRPKAVMLSHRNIMANLRGAWNLLERHAPTERAFLSFLPLSHSYEHTVGQFMPLAIGGEIWYAEGVESLSSNLLDARPRILPCVPRLFEVFRQRIVSAIQRQGGLKKRLFDLTVALGTRRYYAGGRLPLHLALVDALLDRLVRRQVVARFGGRLTAMVCGGGPLNPEIGVFFTALGVPVCHGYGQTETSPVVSVTPPWSWKLQTVGPPLDGVEVKIAPDGEILVRGDLVMRGYWRDEAATAQAIRDGWLHTGDVGLLDREGFLQITDRKRDIIVLSGGDNVAPQRVEAVLAMEPEIGQVVVHGDRCAFLTALIVPSPELKKELARELGKPADDPVVVESPQARERIDAALRRANARLGNVERVRRWALRGEPFSIENGLMTPTLKLRRGQIYKEHRELFEGLQSSARDKTAAPV